MNYRLMCCALLPLCLAACSDNSTQVQEAQETEAQVASVLGNCDAMHHQSAAVEAVRNDIISQIQSTTGAVDVAQTLAIGLHNVTPTTQEGTTCQADLSIAMSEEDLFYASSTFASQNTLNLTERLNAAQVGFEDTRMSISGFVYEVTPQGVTFAQGNPLITLVSDTVVAAALAPRIDMPQVTSGNYRAPVRAHTHHTRQPTRVAPSANQAPVPTPTAPSFDPDTASTDPAHAVTQTITRLPANVSSAPVATDTTLTAPIVKRITPITPRPIEPQVAITQESGTY